MARPRAPKRFAHLQIVELVLGQGGVNPTLELRALADEHQARPRNCVRIRADRSTTCPPAEVLAKDNVGAAEKPASLLARRSLGFQLALSRIVDGLTEQPCHLLRGMEA